MFIKTVILSLASLSHGKEILKRSQDESSPTITEFSWASFLTKTGIDPIKYAYSPSDNNAERFACTMEPGPDRLDCPVAIAAWLNLTNTEQYVDIPFGRCLSVTEGTCRTAVCAPTGDLSIPSIEITGQMWNPISIKCVLGGFGGIWRDSYLDLVIEMGYASQE